MATVKKAALKKAAPAPAPKAVSTKPRVIPVEEPQTESQLAEAYLADRVYDALLERGEAAKISEITLEIDNPRITFPLVRRALDDSSKFALAERQWSLASRYLDVTRPVERTLIDVLRAAGKPLDRITLATELSEVYHRDATQYFPLIDTVTRNPNTYFKAKNGGFGLTEWLPLTDGEVLTEVQFDNEVAAGTLAHYADAAKNVDWKDPVAATVKIIENLKGKALPGRVLGVLAWQALGETFDSKAHFLAAYADSRLTWLTGKKGGSWLNRELVEKLERNLEALGADLAHEAHEEPAPVAVKKPEIAPTPKEEKVEEAAAPVAVVEPEPAPTPTAVPELSVSDTELAALEALVKERGGATDAADLLALQYEVVPGDPSHAADLVTLTERLKADPRFLYVGAGRFREPDSLPLFVFAMPEMLSYPELQFVSMDGEIMDEEIEDEGYVGTLRQDALLPLAQDAGDDEGRYTGPAQEDPSVVRCVVKAHHKEIGTFPLCQIPDDFLPSDANVVEIAVRDNEGGLHEIIVNRDIRLAFGFFGLYDSLPHDSGSVFLLRRGARPYEFRFEPQEEADPQVHVTPERIAELISLREQAEESGDVATFDMACEVLDTYPKGLDFVQTMTEVNLIRRVTRRKLASILSNYLCFQHKAGTSQWRYDARKRDMGTDRTKRKYLKR
ncbi:MAG: hypothetical protein QM758_19495 [Armatimonas sp.]